MNLHDVVNWGILHEAFCILNDAAIGFAQPSTRLRPKLSIDGNKWCALYGENLQDGVAGFGSSPAKAMSDFDTNYYRDLP